MGDNDYKVSGSFIKTSIGSYEQRLRVVKGKAIEAIEDGQYGVAAMLVTEAQGYAQAIDELEFISDAAEEE